jgi:Heterokaryon incompatibility protein (HET)
LLKIIISRQYHDWNDKSGEFIGRFSGSDPTDPSRSMWMIRQPCRQFSLQHFVHHGLWITKCLAVNFPGRNSVSSISIPFTRLRQPVNHPRFYSTLAQLDNHDRPTPANELVESHYKASVFQYPSLVSNSNLTGLQKIRLLELLPGHDSEPVQCLLRQASLLENPKYEALSYCWGDPNDRTNITCNEKSLSVPKTLAGALRGVRFTDRPRVLWADAICINQLDTSEKEHQVQLMRKIYSQSQGTLIWLGDAGESKGGISFWAKVAVRLGLAVLRPRAGSSPQVQLQNVREMRSYNVSPFSTSFYLMLISMLRQPWFQRWVSISHVFKFRDVTTLLTRDRAWVVQEVVTASKATLVWGSVQCAWEDLIRALQFMSNVNFPLAFLPTLQHIGAIENERARYKEGANTLLGLLLRQQRCMTTDPRDKVYAFCGLMGTSVSEKIGVNISYHEDVHSIYRETAMRILKHDRTLDILSLPPSIGVAKTTDLPSWVPDWSRSVNIEISQMSGHVTTSLARKKKESAPSSDPDPLENQFSATRFSTYTPSFSLCGQKLLLSGYVFDTITSAGPIFTGVRLPHTVTNLRSIIRNYTHTLKSFLRARHVFLSWESIACARSPQPYIPTGQSMLPVYFHTVSAGTYPDSKAIQLELYLWDKINCFTPSYLSWLSLWKGPLMDFFTLIYSAKLFLWYALSNKPLLKFELQARYTLNRRMIRTEKGYIGLAAAEVRESDRIVLCKGSRVPLVMRRYGNADEWRLVGDCYVHGVMEGEGFEEGKCGELVVI